MGSGVSRPGCTTVYDMQVSLFIVLDLWLSMFITVRTRGPYQNDTFRMCYEGLRMDEWTNGPYERTNLIT